jgi:hypothetical protein
MRRSAPEVIAFTGTGDRLAVESVSKVSGIRRLRDEAAPLALHPRLALTDRTLDRRFGDANSLLQIVETIHVILPRHEAV